MADRQANQSVSQPADVSRSAIYRGTIRHRRFTPVLHRFSYRLSMPLFDLDHADRELANFPVSGTRKLRIGSFLRSDYVGDGPRGDDMRKFSALELKQYVLNEVRRKTGIKINGKVLLLTHLRYWGFMMNPIAIFYCYDRTETLKAVALQVTNTPWREKVLYVVPRTTSRRTNLARFSKSMHVSPFNPMEMDYLSRFQPPGERLFFHLENHRVQGDRETDATMLFDRTPMTRAALVRLCLGQPAMTLKTGFGIYWQALRLWLKRAPIYDHPATIAKSATVSPGHESLHPQTSKSES